MSGSQSPWFFLARRVSRAGRLSLVFVKEDCAVGAVYELTGLGLLELRARNSHVACRTAPVLNGGEGASPVHSARPCQQPLQKRPRLRLLAQQSLAQDLQPFRIVTHSGDLFHRVHLGFCCRHFQNVLIPSRLFGLTAVIQLPFPSCCPRGCAGSGRVNLLQHASDANQVMAEDLLGGIEQLEYALIAYRVVDVGAIFAGHHNIPVTQHRELLRSIRRLDGETLTDLVHCQLALTQCVEDRDSQRVGQRLEELGFENAELLPHADSPFTFTVSIPLPSQPCSLKPLSEPIY